MNLVSKIRLKTRKLSAAILLLVLIAFSSFAQEIVNKKVTIHQTAQSTSDRLTFQCAIGFQYNPQPEEDEATVFIDDYKTFQSFLGMGGAFAKP